MKLAFRTAGQADLEPLWKLHQETMKAYVDATYGWDDAVQEAYFKDRFRPQTLTVVECDGQLAGCYSLEQGDARVYLASMEIAPAFQNRGIGAACLARFQVTARERGLPLELYVMKANPGARRLYLRSGFLVVGEISKTGKAPTHDHMRWIPGP